MVQRQQTWCHIDGGTEMSLQIPREFSGISVRCPSVWALAGHRKGVGTKCGVVCKVIRRHRLKKSKTHPGGSASDGIVYYAIELETLVAELLSYHTNAHRLRLSAAFQLWIWRFALHHGNTSITLRLRSLFRLAQHRRNGLIWLGICSASSGILGHDASSATGHMEIRSIPACA